jgi:methyl-accepting chemotaxis protein
MAIFWRLILGYCSILAVGVAFSVYAVFRLGEMSGTAESALRGDQLLLGYEEKLTDAILSQVRYGGKFVITRAPAQLEQFRQFKKDFLAYLAEVEKRAGSPELKSLVLRIHELHQRYHYLFDEEARYLAAATPYAESRFRQEKQQAVEGVLAELEKLRHHAQRSLHEKLESLEATAASARTVAAVVAALLWSLGLGLAFLIARGITGPIAEVKRQALAIAHGVPLPPRRRFAAREIEELGSALDLVREKLASAQAANEAFAERVSERLATVARAVRERARSLAAELATGAMPEQRRQLEIIAEESEYALRFLAEVAGRVRSPAAPASAAPGEEQLPFGLRERAGLAAAALAARSRRAGGVLFRRRSLPLPFPS